MNELNNCKEKGNKYANKYIKKIQDTYKQDNLKMKKLMVNNKEKQKIQKKKFFSINYMMSTYLGQRHQK